MTGPQMWKSMLDFVLACVLTVFALPLMSLAMFVVHLTSPGPVIYSQARLGQYGRRYTIYKIPELYRRLRAADGAAFWSTPKWPSLSTWIR